MRDGEGRLVEYLRLSVTDRCNCRCTYCMPAGGVPMLSHADVCSFEELVEITAALAELGVRKVRLTGGEPLVRRGVVGLVEMLRAVGGVEEVDLTTNATLLAPLAAPLRAAGLDRVNVSLDTLDAARYEAVTRGGRLVDALAGIEAARAAGFSPIKINCVLMGGVNDDEVPRLAALAREAHTEVRFIELMPIGEAACWPRGRFVDASAVLDAVPELRPCGTDGVAELFSAPGWAGRVGLIRPMSHRFCSRCTRVRVTADGRLKPCLHTADEVALRGLHGEALREAILAGIALKPAHHGMDGAHASESARAMNEIGG
ncbi:MAG TPA: GTP 3',8-cyclase MoaA [Candidatus Olsenella avistercoris]|nr:GTP 3',8-cyclase MoaA [Candidatus Olsenella avistercoris]